MSTRAYQGSARSAGESRGTQSGRGSVQYSAWGFDNVVARAAASNLTAAQVAQRQRDMMSSQIQTAVTALNGGASSTTTGASGSGAAYSPWLTGIGAQFAVDSIGPSGAQCTAQNGKK